MLPSRMGNTQACLLGQMDFSCGTAGSLSGDGIRSLGLVNVPRSKLLCLPLLL